MCRDPGRYYNLMPGQVIALNRYAQGLEHGRRPCVSERPLSQCDGSCRFCKLQVPEAHRLSDAELASPRTAITAQRAHDLRMEFGRTGAAARIGYENALRTRLPVVGKMRRSNLPRTKSMPDALGERMAEPEAAVTNSPERVLQVGRKPARRIGVEG